MNLRNLSLTVAVLAVLCAVAWFFQRPTPPASADARIGQPVLAPALANSAVRFKLTDQGRTVELVRAADGTWTVPGYHDFPADFAKFSRLIDDLTAAKIQRLVTTRPERLTRLEFKDSTLGLLDATGKDLWQVTLGKTADGGGRFLRYGTESKGYLANLSIYLDGDPKGWADATLLNLKPDDIAQIEVGFSEAGAPAVTARRAKKEEAWTAANPPTGKRLKADRFTSLLSSVTNLRFTDTTAPDDANAAAARAHSRTLKLTTFDGKSYTITLGRKPEEKKPKAATPAGEPATPPAASSPAAAGPAKPAGAEKPKEPEFETIPAGPVFAFIFCSDEKAGINTLMKKRAFQIGEWTYTGLPAAQDLWEDTPPAPPSNKPADGK